MKVALARFLGRARRHLSGRLRGSLAPSDGERVGVRGSLCLPSFPSFPSVKASGLCRAVALGFGKTASEGLSLLGACLAASLLAVPGRAAAPAANAPQNIAVFAAAAATSEHSSHYQARFAIDGRIPVPGAEQDLDQAWCVNGDTHRQGAELILCWTNEVTVAEIHYFARTAWYAEEGWKDYEVWLDSAAAPAAQGRFKQGHGPQPIRLAAPSRARQLKLKFLSSYGGFNPGASEIKVYSTPVPPHMLARFVELPPGKPKDWMDGEVEEQGGLAATLAAGELGFDRLVLIQRRELNPSHVYTYHVEGFGAGGGLCLLQVSGPSAGQLTELAASPKGQILDCDVSFDGREILFSWRRSQHEGYQVFRVGADGQNLRQLTDGPHHNYNACWLPDGGIAFLSTRASRFAYCWVSPVGVLYRMGRDGADVRRLSANIVNDFTPSVMADGRIIYSRWEYVDKPAIPIQSLWTLRPDGTGLAGFFGNRVLSPATFMEARSIPGTDLVLCLLTSHNGPCRGAIGIIDIFHGNNAQAGIRNLTPEVNIGRADQGDGNSIRGPYENPVPVDENYFLVSKRGNIVARSYDGQRQTRVIARRADLGFYNPQPLRARPAPPILAGQISPADDLAPVQPNPLEESDASVAWATVVLQDVYRGLDPFVKRGEVAEICVVEEMRKAVRTDVNNRAFGFQFPVISCGATYAGKKVWGYAPVAADGSACFEVPAGRPLYFMALDARGRAVQRMRTFTHLMPGEIQGCVGCHEPRQQVVAGRSVAPRRPDRLRPPEWGQGLGFDYSSIVQPVLDAHCVRCHSGPAPPARVDLRGDKTDFFNVSYETLARGRKRSGEAEWDSPYVSWIPTYNGMEQNILEVTPKAWGSPRSKLADLLLSGHPETNGAPRLKMPAPEIRRVLAWIDLNVPYYGTSETAHPDKRGCRQIYPADLDKTLAEVARRRCAECHKEGRLPRPVWTRITHPERNGFLMAPLAREAGGSQACGRPVFASTSDPDYAALLKTFDPVRELLRARPRMDMPGAAPAQVDRSCLGRLD